jgi:hypothetical protein
VIAESGLRPVPAFQPIPTANCKTCRRG